MKKLIALIKDYFSLKTSRKPDLTLVDVFNPKCVVCGEEIDDSVYSTNVDDIECCSVRCVLKYKKD